MTQVTPCQRKMKAVMLIHYSLCLSYCKFPHQKVKNQIFQALAIYYYFICCSCVVLYSWTTCTPLLEKYRSCICKSFLYTPQKDRVMRTKNINMHKHIVVVYNYTPIVSTETKTLCLGEGRREKRGKKGVECVFQDTMITWSWGSRKCGVDIVTYY